MKKLETEIESFLPIFPGFYGTLFEPDEELSILDDYKEYHLDFDDTTFNYLKYKKLVAIECINEIKHQLKDLNFKIEIKFLKIESPKEYNFINDSILVDYITTEKTRLKIIKY
jgi:hypothetical protein